MAVIENKHMQILLLISVASATLIDSIDGSIINIILPVIAQDFGVDAGTSSWVVLTYLLVIAGLILIVGKLADGEHIKKIFLTGFLIFTIGSAACGLSPSLEILLVSRLFQGLGAAMIIACGPLICVKFLPMKMLGVSFAVITAAGSIGFAVGPALGGAITYFLSWHWVFLINIPIGIISFLFAARVIPHPEKTQHEKFDIIGSLLLFAAIANAIFCIERLPHLGVTNPQIIITGLIAASAVILFIIRELKCENPVLNVKVFRLPRLVCVYFAFFLMQSIYCGVLYLLPFYLTAGLNMNSLIAGLFMFITPLTASVISIPIGRWSDRTGSRRWFMVFACAAITLECLIYVFITPEWNISVLIITLILCGLAIGISGGPGGSRIVEEMPKNERSLGSSLMITCVYFGGVIGTALFASMFTILTSAGGVVSFENLDFGTFMYGFHFSMLFSMIIAAIATVLSVVVNDKKIKSGDA